MTARGFSSEDFGRRHPGGKIGLQLQTLDDWLHAHPNTATAIPTTATMDTVITAITQGGTGCVAVIDKQGMMKGIITDGDLRRAIEPGMFDKVAKDIMTQSPISLTRNMRISEVILLFSKKRISNAFIQEFGKPIGLIHMKNLLQEGYL